MLGLTFFDGDAGHWTRPPSSPLALYVTALVRRNTGVTRVPEQACFVLEMRRATRRTRGS
ncbi:hypothetical protein PISMIDRAFT_685166 [Pisolithus microcarpus 441]|uniref:Uncharacterized protein n=1 Tax=Pisolithus microcarpus 441 TaxID=765257 RepID=A0A0C9XYM0_9AGAM|nr:hypothetical protein PISMIDRAFT_685166 [Pisolithus microcarpus 441]